jgi:hypothetical protein
MPGFIGAFVVLFQKIDSQQQDAKQMAGFLRYRQAGFRAVRPFRNADRPGVAGGKRP